MAIPCLHLGNLPVILCQDLQWGAVNRPLTPRLNLRLPAGSLTAVVGANGSGKSSLLKVIAGLQMPLSGRVRVALPDAGGIGYLVQQSVIDRQFPIDLAGLVSGGFWGQRITRSQRRRQLEQVLEAWDLGQLQSRPLQALSGGELQRALLARLSLTKPSLVLLDEPDAALDDNGQALLWRHIDAWHKAGCTLVVVSHDLARLRASVEQCLVIDRQGCRHGPSRALIAQPGLAQVG